MCVVAPVFTRGTECFDPRNRISTPGSNGVVFPFETKHAKRSLSANFFASVQPTFACALTLLRFLKIRLCLSIVVHEQPRESDVCHRVRTKSPSPRNWCGEIFIHLHVVRPTSPGIFLFRFVAKLVLRWESFTLLLL